MSDDTADTPTASESPTIWSYTFRIESYANKASTSTEGEYLEVPLPEELNQFGWVPTASPQQVTTFRCCLETGDREECGREFDSKKGAASHLRQQHDKIGDGITAEHTERVVDAEAEQDGTEPGAAEPTDLGVELAASTVGDQTVPYLRFSPAIETAKSVKLRPYSGRQPRCVYAVAVPAAFTNEESSSPSPLRGAEKNDEVVTEVDFAENELRMYTPETYSSRVAAMDTPPRLSAPVAGILGSLGELYQKSQTTINIARWSLFGGDEFRVTYFDTDTLTFAEEAANQGKLVNLYTDSARSGFYQVAYCDADVVQAVRDRGELTPSPVKIKIMWQGTKVDGGISLYETATEQIIFQLILPKHGEFKVLTSRAWESSPQARIEYGATATMERAGRRIGKWQVEAPFIEETDDGAISIFFNKYRYASEGPSVGLQYNYNWYGYSDYDLMDTVDTHVKDIEVASTVDPDAMRRGSFVFGEGRR